MAVDTRGPKKKDAGVGTGHTEQPAIKLAVHSTVVETELGSVEILVLAYVVALAQEPVEKLAEGPGKMPEEAAEKFAEESAEEPVAALVAESVAESVAALVAEPVEELVVEPVAELVENLVEGLAEVLAQEPVGAAEVGDKILVRAGKLVSTAVLGSQVRSAVAVVILIEDAVTLLAGGETDA